MMPYGMIASGAGSAIQGIAGNLAAAEMDQVARREMMNQNRYRNQSFGLWQPAVQQQGVEQAQLDLQQGRDRRMDAYNQMGQTQLGINDQTSQRGQIAGQLQGQNRAALGAYSDWKLNDMIRKIRLQDELNKISNFSAGDASVFPGLMSDAQHSQDELAMWGKIIAGLGGAASGFGAMNPTAGGGGGGMGSIGGIDAGSGFGGQFAGQV